MKGFYIDVSNNLLDPKHQKAMKEAVWLFMWCLDKMTSITEEGVGRVLGGKPIKYKDLKPDIIISRSTYIRWLNRLKKPGYINVLRTPRGCVLSVNKARKRFKRCAKNGQRCAKNETSNIRHNVSDSNKDVLIKDINGLRKLNDLKKKHLNNEMTLV